MKALEALNREADALSRRLRLVAEEIHGNGALTSGMRSVLLTIAERGPQTVPQIARSRPVSRQHIQVIVNSLKEAGLVELADNAAHKRSKLVALTAAGKDELAETNRRTGDTLAQMTIPLTKKELRSAADTVRQVRELFEGPMWKGPPG